MWNSYKDILHSHDYGNSGILRFFNTSVSTLVVIESCMKDTARLADYVLPTTTFLKIRHIPFFYVPSLGKLWTQLAQRLGFSEDFNSAREQWINSLFNHC